MPDVSGLARRRVDRQHAGYTLTEVMIVLALLAAIAGTSWPALMRPWSRNLVQQAAQEFTEQLIDARIQSIEHSQVYVLRWRPGTGRFELTEQSLKTAANDPSDVSTTGLSLEQPEVTRQSIAGRDESDRADGQVDSGKTDQPGSTGQDLLHGVAFKAANRQPSTSGAGAGFESTADIGPDPSIGEPVSGTGTATDWSTPVWFFPDGSTSNGRWTLVSADGYETDVFLRGFTGAVSVGPVRPASVDPTLADERIESQNDQLTEPMQP
jgi:prepilin-type N-terminal cleavage/methylation domain-containing protein